MRLDIRGHKAITVNHATKESSKKAPRRHAAIRLWLGLAFLASALPALAQSPAEPPAAAPGKISGKIVDPDGAVVSQATVKLRRSDGSRVLATISGDDGQFFFAGVDPGPFEVTVTSAGFAPRIFSGVLGPGEDFAVPQLALAIATAVTEVRVVPSLTEVVEEQVKDQEKQRALGLIPNFYVSYVPNAAPLRTRQKFELAWKTMVDPVTFGLNGVVAGIQQAQNDFSGYGQGAQGYAKRYGASYANLAAGTFIGSAILPSILKQDPRYFYKGSGSKRSRAFYAVANAVICKGDNGRWQANYSSIAGSLAAGGISTLYYPGKDRSAVGLTVENALIGIGATAAANLLQEFLIRKLTPNVSSHDPAKPLGTVGRIWTTLVHEAD